MGLDKCRWSGFFLDASDAIRYGEKNELVLDLPPVREQNFFGIYLPNLTPQYTGQVTVLDPPNRVMFVDTPDATEAYPPVPKVVTRGDQIKVWIELRISARQPITLSRDAISIQGDTASTSEIFWPDADPRWRADHDLRGQRILLSITGTPSTEVRLGTNPKKSCKFTLGEALHAWRARSDRFDPLALELSWPAQQATVKVELVAPPEAKRMVQ